MESLIAHVEWDDYWCIYCHERYAVEENNEDKCCPFCNRPGRQFDEVMSE